MLKIINDFLKSDEIFFDEFLKKQEDNKNKPKNGVKNKQRSD